ncbi:unnamed protein product [Clavelina lepadiformis]|uniref:Uncharacterized protein n=1 Tax=Clavelina lepadiformis TaxID=159417 RepID=A0ABP0FCP4_CLALP
MSILSNISQLVYAEDGAFCPSPIFFIFLVFVTSVQGQGEQICLNLQRSLPVTHQGPPGRRGPQGATGPQGTRGY